MISYCKIIKLVRHCIHFVLYNKNRKLTILVYLYTGYFRFCILFRSQDSLEKLLGKKGMESQMDETENNIVTAKRMAVYVNRIANHTPWESRCLVRALTLQKLLMNNKINSTLYLGVGNDGDNIQAHAWLRCGDVYLTGGTGKEYVTVAKFYA